MLVGTGRSGAMQFLKNSKSTEGLTLLKNLKRRDLWNLETKWLEMRSMDVFYTGIYNTASSVTM